MKNDGLFAQFVPTSSPFHHCSGILAVAQCLLTMTNYLENGSVRVGVCMWREQIKFRVLSTV